MRSMVPRTLFALLLISTSLTSCKTASHTADLMDVAASGPQGEDAPASPVPIFQKDDLLTGLTLEAPLTDLYTQTLDSSAVNGDQSTGSDAAKPKVKGTLQLPNGGGSLAVSVQVRGNSSKTPDQCLFAKLTLKFKDPTAGTIFAGLKKIKIGTHCGEATQPLPNWGRDGNQTEPIREALLYMVLKKIGVVSLFARPAVITYKDTSRQVDPERFPQNPLVRNAFFLEDEDSAAARYGGKVVQKAGPAPTPAVFVDATTNHLDPLNVALSLLAESLAENHDWYLRMTPTPQNDDLPGYNNWNINIISDANGRLLTQVYDWDVSAWCRGDDINDAISETQQRLTSLASFSPEVATEAVARYTQKKQDVYAAVDAAFAGSSDSAGRQNIRSLLDSFYQWLESPHPFAIVTPAEAPHVVPGAGGLVP